MTDINLDNKLVTLKQVKTALSERDNDIKQVKTIQVSTEEPTNENVVLWIDESSKEEFTVPEVKDDDINTSDTWSSNKINNELSEIKGDLATKLDKTIYENDFDISGGIEMKNPEVVSGYVVGLNGGGLAVSGQSHGRYAVEVGATYRITGKSNAPNNVLMGQYLAGSWSQYLDGTIVKRNSENIDVIVNAIGNYFFISYGTYTEDDIRLVKLQKKQIIKEVDDLKTDVRNLVSDVDIIESDVAKNSSQLIIMKNGAFETAEETGKEILLKNALISDYPSIKADLIYSQSGIGTPSIDNVRTIIGVESFEIIHNGELITIPFETPVYGGYIDVNEKKLHITHRSEVIDGENIKVMDSGNILVVYFSGMKSGNALKGVSEWIPTVSSSAERGIRFGANSNASYIYNMSDVLGNASSANEYFKTNPLRVVYPLKTENIIDLSNDKIITEGNDTLSSNVNLTVKYHRKVDAVNKYQGISETGKALVVGADGYVTTGEAGVSVDESLTQRGKAADAKIVGDRINHASTLISEQVNKYFEEHPAMGDMTMQFVNSNDEIILGDELLTEMSGSGWSGTLGSGYTHTNGDSSPLSQVIPNLDVNAVYQLKITTSNARLDGYSDFYVSLGGSQIFETYKGGGSSVSYVFGLIPKGTNSLLEIIPKSEYSGIVTGLSLKKINSLKLTETSMYTKSDGTTVCETRFDNGTIYIGNNSGAKDFYGFRNVAVGDESMANNTDGFWNTALGYNTLHENQHGTRNIAIGFIALQGCITGDRNIAIGTFALEGLTTGRGNVAIGADALQKNNGSYNIGIGVGAGNGSTESIHIGHRAGNGANGKNNVSIGAFANESANGTDFGVAIGYQSGQKVTGKYNTFVGAMAGKHATSGENNIVIGYDTQLPSPSGSNQIVIGKRTHDMVVIAGKIIHFNSDGTVTWDEA